MRYKNFPELNELAIELLEDFDIEVRHDTLEIVKDYLMQAVQLGADHGWWIMQEDDIE